MPFADYFDQRSGRFASFYRSRPIARVLGRGPLFRPLAARGVHVSGIEPADGMVELAEQAAADCGGLADVTKIGWEQLAEWHTGEPFDVAIALGVFDYVPN